MCYHTLFAANTLLQPSTHEMPWFSSESQLIILCTMYFRLLKYSYLILSVDQYFRSGLLGCFLLRVSWSCVLSVDWSCCDLKVWQRPKGPTSKMVHSPDHWKVAFVPCVNLFIGSPLQDKAAKLTSWVSDARGRIRRKSCCLLWCRFRSYMRLTLPLVQGVSRTGTSTKDTVSWQKLTKQLFKKL